MKNIELKYYFINYEANYDFLLISHIARPKIANETAFLVLMNDKRMGEWPIGIETRPISGKRCRSFQFTQPAMIVSSSFLEPYNHSLSQHEH